MKTVFLTGISGFVGAHLAKKLVERGYNVVGLTRDFSTKKTLDMLGVQDRVTLVYGDILDQNVLKRAMADYNAEYVFHLAAMSIVSTAMKVPAETFKVNCVGTANLLDACKELGIAKSILVTSTDKVYGEGLDRKETDPPNAVGIYERSKIAEETVAAAFRDIYNLPVVMSRACNIYGEFDTNRRIVSNTMRALRNNEKPLIFKNDNSLREYIYVEDVCDALVLLAENVDKTKGEVFNIGTGESVSQEQMVKKIIAVSGKKIEPVYAERDKKFYEIERQTINSEKIRRAFGWKPRFTLDEGLKRTWEAEKDA